jgi:hypothetical protein
MAVRFSTLRASRTGTNFVCVCVCEWSLSCASTYGYVHLYEHEVNLYFTNSVKFNEMQLVLYGKGVQLMASKNSLQNKSKH